MKLKELLEVIPDDCEIGLIPWDNGFLFLMEIKRKLLRSYLIDTSSLKNKSRTWM